MWPGERSPADREAGFASRSRPHHALLVRIRQYVYFRLLSEVVTADSITDALGVDPDRTYWAMVRDVRPHLRFALIWSAAAVIAAAALLLVRLPLFIVLVALVWVAVLIGAWQWRPKVNRVPSISFSAWMRAPTTHSRSTPK